MKRLETTIAIFVAFIFIANGALAHGVEKVKSVEEVVNEIVAKQNMASIDEIDCNKISGADFEQLGDALMERMVGSHELHEQMDDMMGGEGSESLKQMHIAMGRNWLGCSGLQGMMGMMPMMMRMMGNYYPAYYTGYNTLLGFSIVGWVLSAISIILLVFVVTGKIKVQKRRK
ncbi:MAG: hypothetical protein HY361_03345 [Candidatus Aenigmarchaeota archaeon]|nr:hypothetical protein [Candidatus Aenigmarchaeota archaeon]